jgi:hypothetical protein
LREPAETPHYLALTVPKSGITNNVPVDGCFAIRVVLLYSQANMRVFMDKKRFQWTWAGWLGILCIALVLLTGFIQVAHTHPVGQVDHEGCSLCNTAHHVVQTVALVSVVISIQPVWRITPSKPVERPRQKFLFKLANRPPPVSLIAA